MERLKKSWLVVSVVVTFFVMVPRHGVAGDLRLTLVVYDHAHLGAGKLAEVEDTTSEIFRRTGVQLVWIEGFGYAAKRRDVLTPAHEDPATLVVKLQPESEAARYGVRSVCGGIGFASGAIIFVPRVDPRSTVSDVTRIGYVIAHEIGHILLGANAHSIVGIMRGTLLPQDWEKAGQGTRVHSQSEPTDPNLDRRERALCGYSARPIAGNNNFINPYPSRETPVTAAWRTALRQSFSGRTRCNRHPRQLAKFAAETVVDGNDDHRRGILILQAMPRRCFQARSDGSRLPASENTEELVSRDSLYC